MKPSSILYFFKRQSKIFKNREDAIATFEKQKEALNGIRNTQGLQEIKEYRMRVYDDAVVKVTNEDAKNVGKVAKYQGEINTARSFLSFLDNILD